MLSLMCALVSLLAVLPYTTPEYEVEVERDGVYAQAEGYWTHAPVGEKGSVSQNAARSASRTGTPPSRTR